MIQIAVIGSIIVVLLIMLIIYFIRIRTKNAGIAAALATKRNYGSFFVNGSGRDYITNRLDANGNGIPGKSLNLGKYNNVDECRAVLMQGAMQNLFKTKPKGYAYDKTGTCIALMDKSTNDYIPAGPEYIFGYFPGGNYFEERQATDYTGGRVTSSGDAAIYSTGVTTLYGRKDSLRSCSDACGLDLNCNAYTYLDTDIGNNARQCYGFSEIPKIGRVAPQYYISGLHRPLPSWDELKK